MNTTNTRSIILFLLGAAALIIIIMTAVSNRGTDTDQSVNTERQGIVSGA